MTTSTNIKNLPTDRQYFTERGWSQSYPWVVVKRTAKTVTLAKVKTTRDPEFKPDFVAGGYAGYCTNQHEQTWLFDGFDENDTTVIRMTKKGWARKGTRYTEDVAREFYDYNF